MAENVYFKVKKLVEHNLFEYLLKIIKQKYKNGIL